MSKAGNAWAWECFCRNKHEAESTGLGWELKIQGITLCTQSNIPLQAVWQSERKMKGSVLYVCGKQPFSILWERQQDWLPSVQRAISFHLKYTAIICLCLRFDCNCGSWKYKETSDVNKCGLEQNLIKGQPVTDCNIFLYDSNCCDLL